MKPMKGLLWFINTLQGKSYLLQLVCLLKSKLQSNQQVQGLHKVSSATESSTRTLLFWYLQGFIRS